MIQIDMPMPTNCIDCPACNEYLMCAIPRAGAGWGENDVRDFSDSRPEWCPMKEREPVKPVKYNDAAMCIKCGSCGEWLLACDKFCSNCGREIKWND